MWCGSPLLAGVVLLAAGFFYLVTHDLSRLAEHGISLPMKITMCATKHLTRSTLPVVFWYYGDERGVEIFRGLVDFARSGNRKVNFCPVEHLVINETIGPALWVKCDLQNSDAVKSRRGRPLIVYFHGSGFAIHSPENFLPVAMHLSNETKADVISLRYRLAPVNTFPAAVDDALGQVGWILENTQTLGIDPDNIFLAGDSAGGNLVINAALKYGDKIKSIHPIYPVSQAFHFRLPSSLEFEFDPAGVLDKRDMVNFVAWYFEGTTNNAGEICQNRHVSTKVAKMVSKYFKDLSQDGSPLQIEPLHGVDNEYTESLNSILLDPRISPILAPDDALRKLPPTYIHSCYHDVIRDDGIILAKRLREVGVKVTHKMLRSCWHGAVEFLLETSGGKDLLKEVCTAIKKELEINVL